MIDEHYDLPSTNSEQYYNYYCSCWVISWQVGRGVDGDKIDFSVCITCNNFSECTIVVEKLMIAHFWISYNLC